MTMEITDAMVEAVAVKLRGVFHGETPSKVARELLEAALSAAPVAVKVKPLKFDELRTEARRYFQCNTVIGQYQISYLGEFECWQLYSPQKSQTWKECFSRYHTSDEAKSAAQADYERRILSALSPAPVSAEPEQQPVTHRAEEAGFVEFLNEDVPYVVREIDGRCAILLGMNKRDVIGYWVYDPGCSDSDVFSSPPDLAAEIARLKTELEVRQGDLHMLKRAIEEGDPKSELLVRVNDAICETRAALADQKGPRHD